jgi:hypothetical protein
MHGDQRRGKREKGYEHQDHRTDTTCGELPDKASEARHLSPRQSHGTGAENRPWFELHVTMLCHIALICIHELFRPGSPWVREYTATHK